MDKYAPKPLIEEHYHIQHLIDVQQKRSNDKIYHQNKAKEDQERENTINEAKWFVLTDFFCTDCDKDFIAQAVKEIEQDWSCSNQRVAFYKTKCFCGKWCIRYITDKFRDPYWFKSRAVRADRIKYHDDLLQPFESGYSLLYGHKR